MSVRVLLTTCLAVALAVVALEPAAAAPKNKKANLKNQAPDVAIITQLEDVHKLLSVANPRYAGHRVKAMAAIRKAIDALEHDKGKGTDHKLSRGDDKADETKTLSDTQVRAAGATLQTLHGQVTALPGKHYRTRAATHLGDAIREVNLALEASARK